LFESQQQVDQMKYELDNMRKENEILSATVNRERTIRQQLEEEIKVQQHFT
jgi:hypothetical protein